MAHRSGCSRLIVADIAPVQYPPHHDEILEGLEAMDLSAIAVAPGGRWQLARYVEEVPVRQFLLKNLVREEDHFAWRMNLGCHPAPLDRITAGQTAPAPLMGPVLFIKGGDSAYIQDQQRDQVLRLFPNAQVRVIPEHRALAACGKGGYFLCAL